MTVTFSIIIIDRIWNFYMIDSYSYSCCKTKMYRKHCIKCSFSFCLSWFIHYIIHTFHTMDSVPGFCLHLCYAFMYLYTYITDSFQTNAIQLIHSMTWRIHAWLSCNTRIYMNICSLCWASFSRSSLVDYVLLWSTVIIIICLIISITFTSITIITHIHILPKSRSKCTITRWSNELIWLFVFPSANFIHSILFFSYSLTSDPYAHTNLTLH